MDMHKPDNLHTDSLEFTLTQELKAMQMWKIADKIKRFTRKSKKYLAC